MKVGFTKIVILFAIVGVEVCYNGLSDFRNNK